MKQQIHEFYDSIHMPQDCAEKIIRAAREEGGRRTPLRRVGNMAAAFLTAILIAGLCCNTQVRAAVNTLIHRVFYGGAVTVQVEEGRSFVTMDTGAQTAVTARDGRLYCTAGGAELDITDETSLDKAFLHTYTDEAGVKHCLIIGGTPENYGLQEFFQEDGMWIGGYGSNYLDPEGYVYPWVAEGFEQLNIPWPLPGPQR